MSKFFVIPGGGRLVDSEFTLPTIWIQRKVPKRWPFPLGSWSIFHCHAAKMQGAVTWNSTWIPLEGDAFSQQFFCHLWFVNCWYIVCGCICLSCCAAQNCNIWCVLHAESYSLYFEIGRYDTGFLKNLTATQFGDVFPTMVSLPLSSHLWHRMIPLSWHEILGRIDWFFLVCVLVFVDAFFPWKSLIVMCFIGLCTLLMRLADWIRISQSCHYGTFVCLRNLEQFVKSLT